MARQVGPRLRSRPRQLGLLDLALGDCRFPLHGSGPAYFCGEPAITGCSWCAAHRAVVYAKPAERLAARKPGN